jgi:transposase-like protein
VGSPVSRHQEWSALLAEQATSGLRVAEFCRQKDVTRESFYHWRKKLKSEESSAGESEFREPTVAEFFAKLAEPPKEDQQRNPFVPLTIVRPSVLEVDLSCGATLRLPDGNERLLRQVLQILLEREVVQP